MPSLSGLSSGLDTNALVEQLMAIERQPQVKLSRKQRQIETRNAAINDVASRLRNLKNTAADLRSVSVWAAKQTASSSDATKAEAKITSTAAPGGYSLSITQLARAEQRTFAYTASTAATTLTVNGTTYDVAANATVDDVAAQINADASSAVYATKVGTELVLSGKATGAANTINASGSQIVEDASKRMAAQDATYSLDGGATTRSSATNVVTDAIAGVELTLKGVTANGADVSLNVTAAALDKDAVKAKVKAFVEQYNSTVDLIRQKTTEQRVAQPKTEADYTKGLLKGDAMLTSTLSQLRAAVMNPVSGTGSAVYDELAEIGVSTGASTGGGTVSADAVSGKLVLDEAKLGAALDADPTAVKALLGGVTGVEGIAQRFESSIGPVTGSGGSVEQRVASGNSELSRVKSQMTDLDRRLELREKGLRARFAALEKALASSQQQGNWLSAQLRGL